MKEILKEIYSEHESLRSGGINLLPSENQMSPLARAFLMGDMGSRYFFSSPYSDSGIKYSYSGTDFIEKIVTLGHSIAVELFKSRFVSFYPISGHNANLTLLLRYCKCGDNVVVFDPAYGGYPGLDRNKLPGSLGLSVHYFPVREDIPELIDTDRSIELLMKTRPKLIIYSQAHTLFPVPLEKLLQASRETDSVFVYDGSHPLGLIAGGIFQDPLAEGADYLVGGTQKSLPGPQGGIILSNTENIEQYEHFITVDNPHFNRIAATIVTLAEMKEFGREYAGNVVNNTRYLAGKLFERGFSVLYPGRGFTDSHMFKIKVDGNYPELTRKLQLAGIFLDSSGRIGCGEMTRFGMGEHEFDHIADLFERISKATDPSAFRKEVRDLRSPFGTVHYTFDP